MKLTRSNTVFVIKDKENSVGDHYAISPFVKNTVHKTINQHIDLTLAPDTQINVEDFDGTFELELPKNYRVLTKTFTNASELTKEQSTLLAYHAAVVEVQKHNPQDSDAWKKASSELTALYEKLRECECPQPDTINWEV